MPLFRTGHRRAPGKPNDWLGRAVAEHPELGDEPLRLACRHAAMGSWEHARDLLLATGKDWPARDHRISVLSHTALGLQWPTAWLLAEPGSLDARILGAQVDVRELRTLIVRRDPAGTNEFAAAVVESLEELAAAGQDPNPWLSLLMLAPVLGDGRVGRVRWGESGFETGEQSFGWFTGATDRDPESWSAHHLMLEAQISRLRMMPVSDGLTLLDYAAAAAALAAPDSPLAVLGVHAAAAIDLDALRPMLTRGEREWLAERIAGDVDEAYRNWFKGGGLRRHPQSGYDLAALAEALFAAERTEEAEEVAAELARLTGVRRGG